MKRIVVLAAVFFLVSSAIVMSQPFTASITLSPGCNLQYWYGQKVCGHLTVSDDALVTRWVEDQYGHVWYHWGTRYYTAGTHTICGYMGLPIGLHIMHIQAERISDGATAADQCEYTVCCSTSVWIPEEPSCSCEDVVFSADIDKAQTAPGEDITVTVTVTNNMGGDCRKKFDAGHLEIDWGILGGNTSPLQDDILVRTGETRTILEERHIIPPVSEGDYNVVIYYSDAECTWIDYATISVKVPTEGSFEILSYPDVINVDERGRIKLLVRNQSQKEAQFIMEVDAPPGLYLYQSQYTTTIPRAGYTEINVEFRPEEPGTHTIGLTLLSEGVSLGTASITIKAEKPVAGELDIVSPPGDVTLGESTSVLVKVTNLSPYDTVYQLSFTGTGVDTPVIPEMFVPHSQSREAEIFMTPTTAGVHEVVIQLTAESQLLDLKTVLFEAKEKASWWPLIIGAALLGGLLCVVLYVVKR